MASPESPLKMSELATQVITYSAAEQLAKDADFKGNSITPYLETARRYYDGDLDALTATERATMRIQELQLLNNEATVLKENPALTKVYSESDIHQLAAASDKRNLDYFLDQGIAYEFALGNKDLADKLDMHKPISAQLMRERFVSLEGLEQVRLNVVYHDMMDHLWAILQMRQASLDTRYADFMIEVGNPFTGFLFSKQAELLSGIGYNTRRFVTDPNTYGQLAASRDAINKHLSPSVADDERISNALKKINNSDSLAQTAGFVINGALGSLLLQRSRAGAVKKIVSTPEGFKTTGIPVSLLDQRYLSIVIDGVETLLSSRRAYRQMQLDLNLTVESMLRHCLEDNLSSGHLRLGATGDISNIPGIVQEALVENAGVSTSYYS